MQTFAGFYDFFVKKISLGLKHKPGQNFRTLLEISLKYILKLLNIDTFQIGLVLEKWQGEANFWEIRGLKNGMDHFFKNISSTFLH